MQNLIILTELWLKRSWKMTVDLTFPALYWFHPFTLIHIENMSILQKIIFAVMNAYCLLILWMNQIMPYVLKNWGLSFVQVERLIRFFIINRRYFSWKIWNISLGNLKIFSSKIEIYTFFMKLEIFIPKNWKYLFVKRKLIIFFQWNRQYYL